MPDADRRIDPETRQRLEQIAAGYDTWRKRIGAVLAVQTIALLVLGAGSLYLLEDSSRQGDEIQEQRVTALVASCEEQNARHDNTIARLDRLAARKPPASDKRTPAERDAALAATVSLIDALAPKRDCQARARQFVK